MVHLIVELSKYALIILFSVYTYECFAVFRNISERKQEKKFRRQARILYAIHFTAYLVIFAVTEDAYTFIFYLAQIILLVVVRNVYKLCYPTASRLLVNNMCMLMTIGFIMITRLSYSDPPEFWTCYQAVCNCSGILCDFPCDSGDDTEDGIFPESYLDLCGNRYCGTWYCMYSRKH